MDFQKILWLRQKEDFSTCAGENNPSTHLATLNVTGFSGTISLYFMKNWVAVELSLCVDDKEMWSLRLNQLWTTLNLKLQGLLNNKEVQSANSDFLWDWCTQCISGGWGPTSPVPVSLHWTQHSRDGGVTIINFAPGKLDIRGYRWMLLSGGSVAYKRLCLAAAALQALCSAWTASLCRCYTVKVCSEVNTWRPELSSS